MAQGTEKLLQLTDVELAYSRSSSKERRKYLTLIEETGTARRGGLGETVRVRTMTGERLACKKLLMPERGAFGSQEAFDSEVEHRERAFREEYDALCRLSNFKGFVKARAYGRIGDMPLILMEWVDGISVGNAVPLIKRAPDAPGGDPLVVAQIGRDVFHLLARLEAETELFVHRDLSASNIMIRTSDRPIQAQVSDGYFDVCFIDFGSATTLRATDGAFTTDTRIIRGATPGYAPPEMLSNDLPRLDELRRSTKIDVYAACSVLYEMLCGHLPFDVVGRTGAGSDYLYKMMNDPAPSGFAEGTPEQLLVDILRKGICATQDARCSSYAMFKMLEFYVAHYDENTGRAAHGKELVALNPRSIDRPDYRFDQVSLSNPLASEARREARPQEPVDDSVETAVMTPDDIQAVSAANAARAAARANYGKAARETQAPATQAQVAQAVPRNAAGASAQGSYARPQAMRIPAGNHQPVRTSAPPAMQGTPRTGAGYATGRPSTTPVKPAKRSSALPKVAAVLVVLAIVAVAAVVVLVVLPSVGGNASTTAAPTGASSAAESSGASANANADTWSGTMVSTSTNPACYGAEAYPLKISFDDNSQSGVVTCDVEVLYHAHNRTTQAGDVPSSAGDVLVTRAGIPGTMDNGKMTITIDESSEMGRDSSVIIECQEAADSATIEATVTSVFLGNRTVDVYSLSKQ
ncbi:MAG: hypothetical protein IJG88_03620 [Eggerthellaceae bacterium]|nr:hypothetical protein [Eggerthellaceae bacterium]